MLYEIELSRHVRVGRRAPTEADIDRLGKQGIRTVIDVRTDQEDYATALSPADEAQLLAAYGINYEHRPMPMVGFTEATLEQIGRALRDAEKPVMIHCASGKRAGMVALAHTCIEAGIPGIEMLEMARNLDLVFGSPDLQHMFASYVNARERRPAADERRESAARADERLRPPLPEDVRTLREELQTEHQREHALDREAERRPSPEPAQFRSPERKRRPLWQPRTITPATDTGAPPNSIRPMRATARPVSAATVGTTYVGIGTPLGLATAGAVVCAVLLLIDRRLMVPVLLAAGALAGRVILPGGRSTAGPAESVAADRAEDREVRELGARVQRLAALA